MPTVRENLSARRISTEKGEIQQAARNETATLDLCGHCGKNIILAPGTTDRWYHYSYYTLKYLSKSDMYRYCSTRISRSYLTQKDKAEARSKLAPKAIATPKRLLNELYRERGKVARLRLQKIHDELKAS